MNKSPTIILQLLSPPRVTNSAPPTFSPPPSSEVGTTRIRLSQISNLKSPSLGSFFQSCAASPRFPHLFLFNCQRPYRILAGPILPNCTLILSVRQVPERGGARFFTVRLHEPERGLPGSLPLGPPFTRVNGLLAQLAVETDYDNATSGVPNTWAIERLLLRCGAK